MTRLHVLDLEYLGTPEAIAAYLLVPDRGRPVLVECGPGSTVGALERGLRTHGVAPADVGDLLVTHIHLDHAGAAGWMAAHGARVHVHDFGAKHLVDPSRLLESAKRIYRERMDAMWGGMLPVPEALVRPTTDGTVITAEGGGLELVAIETPGHARHHHAFACTVRGPSGADERIVFTGDAAGAWAHEAPGFISLPAPPPEFDPEAWDASLDRLEAAEADALYPTHFGRIDDVAGHLDRVRTSVVEHAAFVRERMTAGMDEPTIREDYRTWFALQAEREGLPANKAVFYAKGSVAEMNVTGIMRYWRKRDEADDGG